MSGRGFISPEADQTAERKMAEYIFGESDGQSN